MAPSTLGLAVMALSVSSVQGRALLQASSSSPATCAQLQQQVTTLQGSQSSVSATAASMAAGGPIPQPQANWAPWPAHSWPASQTPGTQAVQQVANDVESTDAGVTTLLQQMQQQGCTLSCQQMQQLITELQTQSDKVGAVSATISAGGPIPQPQANWAPWPAHSWPASQTPTAQAVNNVANQVQATDDEVNTIWQQMQASGC